MVLAADCISEVSCSCRKLNQYCTSACLFVLYDSPMTLCEVDYGGVSFILNCCCCRMVMSWYCIKPNTLTCRQISRQQPKSRKSWCFLHSSSSLEFQGGSCELEFCVCVLWYCTRSIPIPGGLYQTFMLQSTATATSNSLLCQQARTVTSTAQKFRVTVSVRCPICQHSYIS